MSIFVLPLRKIYKYHMHGGELIPMQMEEQLQKRKKQTKTELPQEIIHDEILIRLPVKSLIRFKCVCKSWLSLFSDPEFTKLHVSRQCHDQNYLVKNRYMLELKIISRFKESNIVMTTACIGNSLLLGSVNGVICFASPDVFTLWNPVIRQYKELSTAKPHSSICKKKDNWTCRRDFDENCRHLYGFGWDPSGNDYKVVIVCYVSPDSKCGSVYSCKSDSWTQLVLPAGIFGVKSRSFIKSPSPSIIVKACPYWSCSKYLTEPGKRCKRRYTVVFKFVAETNEFKLLPGFDLARQEELKLINLKDCLAGMPYKVNKKYPFHTRFIDVYSLDHEGSAGVWTKMYTLGAMDFGFLYCQASDKGKFTKYRELERLLCYDSKTNVVLDAVDAAPFRLMHFTHTHSLVFVHGMKHLMHSET